jgi:hypothetical protein
LSLNIEIHNKIEPHCYTNKEKAILANYSNTLNLDNVINYLLTYAINDKEIKNKKVFIEIILHNLSFKKKKNYLQRKEERLYYGKYRF